MNHKQFMSAVRIAILTACAYCAAVTKVQADDSFAGRVYDVDYLGRQGWTQVLFQIVPGNSSLVAITRNYQLQRILETALLNAAEVRVTYRMGQPDEIQTAVLRAELDCTEKGCVEEVLCSAVATTCSVKIVGESVEVNTNDALALGILLTAMNKKKAIEYLEVDRRNTIIRVKLNLANVP